MRPLDLLEHEALVGDDDASRGVGTDLPALEEPADLGDPRVGVDGALEVDVVPFLDLALLEGAAQLERHVGDVWNGEELGVSVFAVVKV